MDCPNCGAYNASSSVRCRRCGEFLPSDDGESTESEWGPASGPEERWDDQQEEVQSYGQEPAPSSEAETIQQPDWDSIFGQGSSESDRQQGSTHGSSSPGGFNAPLVDVPNYLWAAVASTLCCCAPLGIASIVYASRVNPYLEGGNVEAAQDASEKAKNWAIASAAVSFAIWFLIFFTGQFSG